MEPHGLMSEDSDDRKSYLAVKVLSQSHGGSDDGSQIEDAPEDADKLALFRLSGICHHQRALCRPQKASTDTEDGTCGDNEATCIGMNVHGTDNIREGATLQTY